LQLKAWNNFTCNMKGNKENWTHYSDFIKEMQYFKFNTTALSVAQSDF